MSKLFNTKDEMRKFFNKHWLFFIQHQKQILYFRAVCGFIFNLNAYLFIKVKCSHLPPKENNLTNLGQKAGFHFVMMVVGRLHFTGIFSDTLAIRAPLTKKIRR